MAVKEKTIEAEIIEIDGVRVEPFAADQAAWTNWNSWQGRIKRCHLYWWPLLLVLGAVLFVLAVGIGMCAVVLLAVWSLVKSLFTGFTTQVKS